MDRRKGPQRAEEVALHYAEVALIAAALAFADDDMQRPSGMDRGLDVYRAADIYRRADAEAVAARAERQGVPAA